MVFQKPLKVGLHQEAPKLTYDNFDRFSCALVSVVLNG